MEFNANTLDSFYQDFLDFLPQFLKGIGFIILAFLIYKILLFITNKLLKVIKVEQLSGKLNSMEILSSNAIEINLNKVIIGIVKFLLILIFIIAGADLLNLPMVSELVGKLIAYLPKLFTAIIIFIVGVYLASQLKTLIQNLLKSFDSNGSKAIGLIVFYVIFIFVSITALNQAGINTEIISNNVSFILGAILVTVTIAVGLGSRDIIYRLILGFYTKKNLEIGMKIKIEEQIGIIESIDNICLVLLTENERIVYPIKKITDTEVKILN